MFLFYIPIYIHSRRLMGSTNQADPIHFYFRISWILMERPWFHFFPLHLVQSLKSLQHWLLQKLSMKIFDQKFRISILVPRGAIEGKTGKTGVLPGFCKIEWGGGSGCVLPCFRGLIWLGRARRASGTPDNFTDGIAELYCLDIIATGFPSSCHTKINLFVCKEQVVIFRYRTLLPTSPG